mmetsp:Transcript_3396/g.11151  ORF Transcript_3396/g.11151 Transcript_3396/m.11151 type:complete len:108 (-) Transcript_3396:102-425(-)
MVMTIIHRAFVVCVADFFSMVLHAPDFLRLTPWIVSDPKNSVVTHALHEAKQSAYYFDDFDQFLVNGDTSQIQQYYLDSTGNPNGFFLDSDHLDMFVLSSFYDEESH